MLGEAKAAAANTAAGIGQGREERWRDRQMEADQRNWVSRIIRNPVAVLGAIGSILVVLANAEHAIDGTTKLWHRWTLTPAHLESTWQGNWKSRNGFHFGFAMQLDTTENGDANGQISWELLATPPNSHLASRVGNIGVEFVRGHYDRVQGLAILSGYEVSDPTLLALDSYKFQLRPDKISFVGMSKHRGEWEAQASGSVIVTQKK